MILTCDKRINFKVIFMNHTIKLLMLTHSSTLFQSMYYTFCQLDLQHLVKYARNLVGNLFVGWSIEQWIVNTIEELLPKFMVRAETFPFRGRVCNQVFVDEQLHWIDLFLCGTVWARKCWTISHYNAKQIDDFKISSNEATKILQKQQCLLNFINIARFIWNDRSNSKQQ